MKVMLTGIEAVGFHGVLPAERHNSQPFVVDVKLYFPEPATDRLESTVDYSAVAQLVVSQVIGPPVNLIEKLGIRIADSLLAVWPVLRRATVTVHKPQAPIGVPFADVTSTVTRKRGRSTDFTLSLGSNLGDSRTLLREAVQALSDTPGISVAAVSHVYRTMPVEISDEQQPDYLNLAIIGTTTLGAFELLRSTCDIETRFYRQRPHPHAARTLDIDLITVGETYIDQPGLTLPHPRAHQRAFVLVPWAQIAPDAMLPEGRVADLANLANRQGIVDLGDL